MAEAAAASTQNSHLNLERLAQRIRKLQPERYFALCRMHLGFLLDLSNEELDGICSWKALNGGKDKSANKNSHKHQKEIELSESSWFHVNALYELIQFLELDNNIREEGLFRKSGNKSRQTTLYQQLNSGYPLRLEFGRYNAHDCANVLKRFLADLPEPLLTEAHYIAHCKIADLCRNGLSMEQMQVAKSRQLQALQLLFLMLPPKNYKLLKHLLELLHKVAQMEHCGNKMSAVNLATMFAPHLMCPRSKPPVEFWGEKAGIATAVAAMIEYSPKLFQIPVDLANDLIIFWEKVKSEQFKNDVDSNSIGFDKNNADYDAVETLLTFCDRHKSQAVETNSEMTSLALAQLYAHISSLPESNKKRQLVKKFNKENGCGSPLISHINHKKTRSLKTSIRHLFGKQEKQDPDNPATHLGAVQQRPVETADREIITHNVCSSKKLEEISTIRHPAFCPRRHYLVNLGEKVPVPKHNYAKQL